MRRRIKHPDRMTHRKEGLRVGRGRGMVSGMFSLFAGVPAPMVTGSIDPLALLLLALALDAVLGEMGLLFRLLPHPVVLMGRAIDALDRRLNRPERGPASLRWRGRLVVLGLVGAAIAVGLGVQAVSLFVPLGWVVELFLVASLLAQRSLYDAGDAVARALDRGGLASGREAVSVLVGRDPTLLDEAGVARATIESLAENFSDAVLAPVFWYVLFGMPGLLACKMVNTLDSMIGYRTPRHLHFGRAAARLDDLVNLIPARLAALVLTLAALGVRWADPRRALRTVWRDAGKHRSPNAGWPEAAMAGALGLALSGPRHYPGQPPGEDPWIGGGRKRARPLDIRRALALFRRACLWQAAVVTVLAVLHAVFA